MKLRKLDKDSEGVEIRMSIEFDDISNLNFDSGEPDEDDKLASEIQARLARGDTWAWCIVTVSASWGGWTGRAVFGGCSYEDEEDFRQNGDYDSMVEEAVEELNKKLEKAAIGLSKLIDFGNGFLI